jgi:LemA protein
VGSADSAEVWAADSAEAAPAEAGRAEFRIENKEYRKIKEKKKMKNFGKVWVVLIVILAVILLFGLGIFKWYINGYNRAVNLEQGAEKTWADIDAALQRRLDLVPNLVETVKGYAEHEEELFKHISDARTKYFQADTRAGKIEASNELGGFLSRLLMLQENYPELKASENFRDLQVALEGTENRINVASTRYNQAAEQLNAYAKQFFGSFFCRRAGIEPVEYFEATERAKTEVPEVKF